MPNQPAPNTKDRKIAAVHDDLWCEVNEMARDAGLSVSEMTRAMWRARLNAPAITWPPKLRIEGTWLVEEVDWHTCGQGEGGHFGAHEPDCGLIPMVDLADLPGWPPSGDQS